MSLKRVLTCLAVCAAGATALPAAAQFAKPEDAVKYRKAGMTMIAAHFGRLGAMANGRVPYNAAAAQSNADIFVDLSTLPFAGFVEGTAGTEKGASKANIWTDKAKFDAGAKAMADAAVKLQAAAKAGNLDALKAAFGPAAGTCKDCHDNYRVQ